MTNPLLSNAISTDGVLLWQYDKAYNLIRVLQKWDQFSKASCEDFWDYFGNAIFQIDEADTYGLNVWGLLMGIPRPTITIPIRSDITDGRPNTVMKDYAPDGYKVIRVSSVGNWKTVTITNDLFRGLLKGRFFLMCHPPTVPNYNKYLAIVFGAIRDKSGINERAIFDTDGNILPGYTSRNKALDFQDMTMGFTFPQNASIEESYLIFQHYDVVYPFPAGIRYPGEFIYDNIVIGLNTDQNPYQVYNQNYKNFVEGLVLATDTKTPQGGIFAETNRANYKVAAKIEGYVYRINVRSNDLSKWVAFKRKELYPVNERIPIWIDWGNGKCGYHYMPAGGYDKTYEMVYEEPGTYAVTLLFDEVKVYINDKNGLRGETEFDMYEFPLLLEQ